MGSIGKWSSSSPIGVSEIGKLAIAARSARSIVSASWSMFAPKSVSAAIPSVKRDIAPSISIVRPGSRAAAKASARVTMVAA